MTLFLTIFLTTFLILFLTLFLTLFSDCKPHLAVCGIFLVLGVRPKHIQIYVRRPADLWLGLDLGRHHLVLGVPQ